MNIYIINCIFLSAVHIGCGSRLLWILKCGVVLTPKWVATESSQEEGRCHCECRLQRGAKQAARRVFVIVLTKGKPIIGHWSVISLAYPFNNGFNSKKTPTFVIEIRDLTRTVVIGYFMLLGLISPFRTTASDKKRC